MMPGRLMPLGQTGKEANRNCPGSAGSFTENIHKIRGEEAKHRLFLGLVILAGFLAANFGPNGPRNCIAVQAENRLHLAET